MNREPAKQQIFTLIHTVIKWFMAISVKDNDLHFRNMIIRSWTQYLLQTLQLCVHQDICCELDFDGWSHDSSGIVGLVNNFEVWLAGAI